MQDKILKKTEMESFLDRLSQAYEVWAPVRHRDRMQWSQVQKGDDLVWEFTNSDQSPKFVFFPQTERLMHFKNDSRDPEGMIMHPEPAREKNIALLNIRPCDAKAFQVLEKVFCQDESTTDIYWKDKREKALLIGLACKNPCPTCFCTSVHCGPHHEEGLDLVLVDLEDKLLVRPLSRKGEELVSDLEAAGQEETAQAAKQKEQAEEAISREVGTQNIQQRTMLQQYEHPLWDRVFESCINCGTCTYYCPTCHCFDIQDETQEDYGQRIRTWDSCMSWLFTYHTSGHNPRGSKKDRVRQRFMHKFKYMPFKLEGSIGCVGCGRCTRYCPVNIDVREVVNLMNEEA